MHPLERSPAGGWSILLACVTAAATCPAAGAEEPTVWAAGNERILWLMLAEQPGLPDEPISIHRTFRRAHEKRFVSWRRFVPEIGRPVRWAVAGLDLHVFFEDGTHRRYTPTTARTERELPDERVPEALAGESQQAVLYAVVPWPVVDKLRQRRLTRTRPTTQPARSTGPSAPQAIPTRPNAPGRFGLVRFERGRWHPWRPVPEWFDRQRRCWLAADRGYVHLFWQDEPSSPLVWYSRLHRGRWARPTPLEAPQAVVFGCALAARTDGVVFLAGLPDDPGRWRLRGFARSEGAWRTILPFSVDRNEVFVRPGQFAAAGFADTIVLAVRQEKDKLVAGRWSYSGGEPIEGFQPAMGLQAPTPPLIDPRLAGWLPVVGLALVLLLVFWRRQESIAHAIALPADIRLAGAGKRLLAFLVDLVPPVVLTSPVWAAPLTTILEQAASGQMAPAEPAPAPTQLWLAWLAVRVVHAVYCAAGEALLGASPGKLALRCRVVSETLVACRPWQILVRNAVRVLELELYFFSLLILIFLTRNRQRLGDIVARTLVVELVQTITPPDNRSPDK